MGPVVKRYEDWPRRMEAAVDAAQSRPFVWGHWDCCLFVAEVTRAMTGEDIAALYRGKYKSRRGAYALLKRIVGGGVHEAAVRAFGAPLAYPLTARRGDAVLLDTPDGDALGICAGPRILVPRPGEGLAAFPIAAARAAWRVG